MVGNSPQHWLIPWDAEDSRNQLMKQPIYEFMIFLLLQSIMNFLKINLFFSHLFIFYITNLFFCLNGTLWQWIRWDVLFLHFSHPLGVRASVRAFFTQWFEAVLPIARGAQHMIYCHFGRNRNVRVRVRAKMDTMFERNFFLMIKFYSMVWGSFTYCQRCPAYDLLSLLTM